MKDIQAEFLKIQNLSEKTDDVEEIIHLILNDRSAFCAVGFEAVAFTVTQNEIKQMAVSDPGFEIYFATPAIYRTFVCIGMGWAFARLRVSPAALQRLQPSIPIDVICDGMGYHDALFHQRKTLEEKQYPEYLQPLYFSGYDTGIGRRLWYHSAGNVEKLCELISSFQTVRQPELWKGAGIAIGYVGSISDATFSFNRKSAGLFEYELLSGVNISIQHRILSGNLLPDTQSIMNSLSGFLNYFKAVNNPDVANDGYNHPQLFTSQFEN